MLVDCGHWNGICPGLEGIAIDAKTEVAGYRDEKGMFPVVATSGKTFVNLPGTIFESFHLKCRQPVVDEERWNATDHILAAWTGLRGQQAVVVVTDEVGNGQQELWDWCSVGR